MPVRKAKHKKKSTIFSFKKWHFFSLLFLLLLFAFGNNQNLQVLQSNPYYAQTDVPSPACLGSECPTIGIGSPTPEVGTTNVDPTQQPTSPLENPDNTQPLVQEPVITASDTTTPEPTIDPCIQSTLNSNNNTEPAAWDWRHHGRRGGVIKILLEMFLMMFQVMMQQTLTPVVIAPTALPTVAPIPPCNITPTVPLEDPTVDPMITEPVLTEAPLPTESLEPTIDPCVENTLNTSNNDDESHEWGRNRKHKRKAILKLILGLFQIMFQVILQQQAVPVTAVIEPTAMPDLPCDPTPTEPTAVPTIDPLITQDPTPTI